MAIALLGSSTAHAAATASARIDPLVALSVFGTSESRAAVCAAGASAAAASGTAIAAQAGAAPGCVLPAVDAPPPVVETAPSLPPASTGPVATGAGVPVLPLLLGLAAIAAFAALVLQADDDDGEINLPISP